MENTRQITEIQIEALYKFTRQHFVDHYDVQTELVDHLANDIEQIWTEKPSLSFEQARDFSFKKFGVFGFMDVVSEKTKAMERKYWKILWRFVKEWFTFPKMIATACLFMIYFRIIQFQYSFHILFTGFVIIAFYNLVNFLLSKRKNNKKVSSDKRWLLKDMIGHSKGGISLITFLNIFNIINLLKFDFSTIPLYGLAIISFLATLLTIIFYVSAIILPKKAEQLLTETYPEYQMVDV